MITKDYEFTKKNNLLEPNFYMYSKFEGHYFIEDFFYQELI